MQKNLYSINKKDLFDLFNRLSKEYNIFVPYGEGERLFFGEFDSQKSDSIANKYLCGDLRLKLILGKDGRI